MSRDWSSYKNDQLIMENWRSHLKAEPRSGEKIEEFFGKKAPASKGTVAATALVRLGQEFQEIAVEIKKQLAAIQATEGGPERLKQANLDPQFPFSPSGMVEEFYDMIEDQGFDLQEQEAGKPNVFGGQPGLTADDRAVARTQGGTYTTGATGAEGDAVKFKIGQNTPNLSMFFTALKLIGDPWGTETLRNIGEFLFTAGFDKMSWEKAIGVGTAELGRAGQAPEVQSWKTSGAEKGARGQPGRGVKKAAAGAEEGEGAGEVPDNVIVIDFERVKEVVGDRVKPIRIDYIMQALEEETDEATAQRVRFKLADASIAKREKVAEAINVDAAWDKYLSDIDIEQKFTEDEVKIVIGAIVSLYADAGLTAEQFSPWSFKGVEPDLSPGEGTDTDGDGTPDKADPGAQPADDGGAEEEVDHPPIDNARAEADLERDRAAEEAAPGEEAAPEEEEAEAAPEEEEAKTKHSFGLPLNFGTKKSAEEGRTNQAYLDLLGSKHKGGDFEADWAEFVDQLGKLKLQYKARTQQQQPVSEIATGELATVMGGQNSKLSKLLTTEFRSLAADDNTAFYRVIQTLRDAFRGIHKRKYGSDPKALFLKSVWDNIVRAGQQGAATPSSGENVVQGDFSGGSQEQAPDVPPQRKAAQESLLRESTINRWQQLSGIKKRV